MLSDHAGTPARDTHPVPTQVVGVSGDASSGTDLPAWRDTSLPVRERVTDLLGRMTMREKIGQLYGVWVGAGDVGEEVAPHQHELSDGPLDWKDVISHGLGQITRPFGTAPVNPVDGARALARMQREIIAASEHGIPAQVHEECLSGFTTWQATIYPTPLAWGATFDPALVERMAGEIGGSMRAVGVHQGLSPVLDVTRDPRWGRTEETIAEDPYLVATIATAYVRGLESSGIVSTLKHFAGYSASKAGRNHAPVSVGPREFADVLLPPFEMAVRDGGARSVMHSYAEVDGMPPAANPALLTELLREKWGFDGVVVADYFGVAFLELLHQVAADSGEAAGLALAAGVDVELPTVRCYGEPLAEAIKHGDVAKALVERAARRVLSQKCELGLLDPGYDPEVVPASTTVIDLDPPRARALAREVAEESVVLLANDGALPLRPDASIALVGPLMASRDAMLGCYSFPRHVGSHRPDLPLGVEIATVAEALRSELPEARIETVAGCEVDGHETAGIAKAIEAATRADVCVAVLGDRADLFGRGTSGEGCDAPDLALPGVQGELLRQLLETGKPVVVVLMTGRPYALGAYADRLAAIVQAFFPGEEGGPAVAGVLSGRVNPSGRLPVSVPAATGGQPTTYLAPPLGRFNDVSNIDPTPLYPFGHGLSYTSFEWEDVRVDGQPVESQATADPVECQTDGSVTISVTVRNSGERAGAEVVQVYLHDPVAQVTRPVVRLIGYARVPLAAGEARRVEFDLHADLSSFTGRTGRRVVEAGDLEVRLSASSSEARQVVPIRLTGPERMVGYERRLTMGVKVL